MPAENRRGQALLLAAAVPPLLALLLGLSGLGFGLPWRITDRDERLVVESAVATFSGDWTPIDLRYPTLFIYMVRGGLEPVARLVAAGESDVAPRVFAHLASDPTPFYRVGRGLALAMGVGAVLGLAALGRRLIGDRYGWLPAMILALTPVFAEFSRYAKVDVPLTLWTILAILSAVRFHEGRRDRDAALTALFTGCALATKWTGVLLFPVLACVAFGADARMGRRDVLRGAVRFLLFGVVAVGTLLATTPHVVLNPAKTVADASRVADHIVRPFGEFTRAGYAVYPEALARSALGAGFLAAAVFGLWRVGRSRAGAWVAPLAFGSVYMVVVFFSRTAYERFLLPVLPVMALLAARGIVDAAQRLRRPVWLIAVLAFLPTAPYLAARVVAGATNADTRLEALELIERRVPAGSSILLFGGERGSPPLVAINAPPFGNLQWINAEAKLGKVRYARAREIVVALQEASGRPAYRIDRASSEDLESSLGTKRPAAIVLYDPISAALPEAAAADYEPAVVFSPRWATWWRHTNAVVLRKDLDEGPRPPRASWHREERARGNDSSMK